MLRFFLHAALATAGVFALYAAIWLLSEISGHAAARIEEILRDFRRNR